MSGARLLRRVVLFASFLAAIELWILVTYPAGRYRFDDCFRLPRGHEVSVLPRYVDHIREAGAAGREAVIFLGASPTYGHRIRDHKNTYPCSFGRAAHRKTFNLASNGQLLSDQYYILESVIDSADVFLIQLNYHTLNPRQLASVKIRNPDMPETVGARVSQAEAGLLGRRPTPEPNLNFALQHLLRGHWALYRERDAVAAEVLGGKPERLAFDKSRAALGLGITAGEEEYADADAPADADANPDAGAPASRKSTKARGSKGEGSGGILAGRIGAGAVGAPAGSAARPGRGAVGRPGQAGATQAGPPSFNDLSPVQQGVIVKRYGNRSHFRIGRDSSELFFLRRMVELLRSKNKKAVFFVTPLNREAIETYELIDPGEYRANLAPVRKIVEGSRFLFLDYNGSTWLSAKYFYDISHTIDPGGRLVGRRIYEDSKEYLLGGKRGL